MPGKIFITGIEMISTVDLNAEEVPYSLKNARSVVGSVIPLESIHKGES